MSVSERAYVCVCICVRGACVCRAPLTDTTQDTQAYSHVGRTHFTAHSLHGPQLTSHTTHARTHHTHTQTSSKNTIEGAAARAAENSIRRDLSLSPDIPLTVSECVSVSECVRVNECVRASACRECTRVRVGVRVRESVRVCVLYARVGNREHTRTPHSYRTHMHSNTATHAQHIHTQHTHTQTHTTHTHTQTHTQQMHITPISGAATEKKGTPVSPAIARARWVLPHPDGL